MYKVYNKILPINLLNMFKLKVNDIHFTRSSTSQKILHKYARTNLKANCISVIGIKLYNEIDEEIRNSINVNIFIKKFKSCILNLYKN